MISVGIDVSKGKSMVCIIKPYGEVVASPSTRRCGLPRTNQAPEIHRTSARLNTGVRAGTKRIMIRS